MNNYALLFRRPLFWLLLISSSISLTIFSYFYFTYTFPLLDIHITMSKREAEEKARQLAHRYSLGPQNFDQATLFIGEEQVQNYVELQNEGHHTFKKLLHDGTYYPYTWQVRHFKEGTPHETLIKFTPAGHPWGFIEHISENEIGACLTAQEAQKKAEEFMSISWEIPKDAYHLIETSQEVRPRGRVDHTFVYERTNESLGEAHYRLVVVVSGDKVTTLNHCINIPDSFTRKYKEMRSTNETISSLASVIVYLIYIFGGCILGLLFLLRINNLIIAPALIAGVLIAGAQAVAQYNQLYNIWFFYDTALSAHTFLLEHIFIIIVNFLGLAALYAISLMTAEGLSRKAFGSHVQLWNIFKPRMASSYLVLGKVMGGYLLTALDFAFIVAFYAVGNHFYGWWSPSQALMDPNIVSSPMPALGALAQALAAGVWEECLFRAIPLAGAALIGNYLGHRRIGIIIGFIAQIAIFGAAHAHYPAQPAYVRIIELIIPSCSFGLLYLAFGLIPGIILHFIYDAILFALPIFISKDMAMQKIIVLIGILAPLLFVIISRLLTKQWLEAPENAFNHSWKPKAQPAIHAQNRPLPSPLLFALTGKHKQIITFLGSLGLLLWFMSSPISSDIPSIQITKEAAITQAYQMLENTYSIQKSDWNVLARIYPSPLFLEEGSKYTKEAEYFILSTQGKMAYNKLMDSYLSSPQWHIRFTKKKGSLIERSKEYNLFINYKGIIKRIQHIIPESQEGYCLEKDEAQKLAYSFIEKNFGLQSTQLEEISAQTVKKPCRQDWIFIFKDKDACTLSKDQARIIIEIAGNEIVDGKQLIHLPEDWLRHVRRQASFKDIMYIIRLFALIVLLTLIAIQAVNHFRTGNLGTKIPLFSGALYGILMIIYYISNFPEVAALFNTSEPYIFQYLTTFFLKSVYILFESILVVLLTGTLVNQRDSIDSSTFRYNNIYLALALGCLYAGILAFIPLIVCPLTPLSPSFIGASSSVPWITSAGYHSITYIKQTLMVLFLAFYATTSKIHSYVSLFLATLFLMPLSYELNVASYGFLFIVTALTLVIIYRYSLRIGLFTLPLITATPVILTSIIHLIIQPYPGSLVAYFLVIVFVTLCCYILIKMLKPTSTISYQVSLLLKLLPRW